TDRHAHRGKRVHEREDRQVARVEKAVPQQRGPHDQAEKRDHDGGDVDVALESSHLSLIPLSPDWLPVAATTPRRPVQATAGQLEPPKEICHTPTKIYKSIRRSILPWPRPS